MSEKVIRCLIVGDTKAHLDCKSTNQRIFTWAGMACQLILLACCLLLVMLGASLQTC